MPSRVTFRDAGPEGNERCADAAACIAGLEVATFVVPTDRPESDGTFAWDRTTLVVVEAHAGGMTGLGYTYGDRGVATVVAATLAPAVVGREAFNITGAWVHMNRAVRNAGRSGIAATAISAVDAALWDLKAKLLGVPLSVLIGTVRDEVPVYGSGGFTSYSEAALQQQLAAWVEAGIPRVKMKVGRDAAADPTRVRAARAAIGDTSELYVDANGAWNASRALEMAARFSDYGVCWFEEPVSSDDVAAMRQVRTRAPLGMEIAAGEYGFVGRDFLRLVNGRAVDVLQADATRCGGITGFLQVAALADAVGIPLSAHTAPSLHTALGCAVPTMRHLEYFHDHVRIEQMLFDGAPSPRNGMLAPDRSRPGMGFEFKHTDAAAYRVG